jgi:hypothetical protein
MAGGRPTQPPTWKLGARSFYFLRNHRACLHKGHRLLSPGTAAAQPDSEVRVSAASDTSMLTTMPHAHSGGREGVRNTELKSEEWPKHSK